MTICKPRRISSNQFKYQVASKNAGLTPKEKFISTISQCLLHLTGRFTDLSSRRYSIDKIRCSSKQLVIRCSPSRSLSSWYPLSADMYSSFSLPSQSEQCCSKPMASDFRIPLIYLAFRPGGGGSAKVIYDIFGDGVKTPNWVDQPWKPQIPMATPKIQTRHGIHGHSQESSRLNTPIGSLGHRCCPPFSTSRLPLDTIYPTSWF